MNACMIMMIKDENAKHDSKEAEIVKISLLLLVFGHGKRSVLLLGLGSLWLLGLSSNGLLSLRRLLLGHLLGLLGLQWLLPLGSTSRRASSPSCRLSSAHGRGWLS